MSRENLLALLYAHAIEWLCFFIMLSLAWVVPCAWQWRGPTGSDLMLATIRATILLALRAEIVDNLPTVAYLCLRPNRRSWLLNTFAIFCTSVVTLPYDYAAWMYSALFAAWVTWQYWNEGL